jgi:hypothetical protein
MLMIRGYRKESIVGGDRIHLTGPIRIRACVAVVPSAAAPLDYWKEVR